MSVYVSKQLVLAFGRALYCARYGVWSQDIVGMRFEQARNTLDLKTGGIFDGWQLDQIAGVAIGVRDRAAVAGAE
jgi:hypothetical protein